MTEDEAKMIFSRLQAAWHDTTIPKPGYAFYFAELRDLPADEVETAISVLGREGGERVPLAGQIRRKVMELRLDPPSWAEAIRLLMRRHRQLVDYREPEGCPDGVEDCEEGWVFVEDDRAVRPCTCREARAEGRLAGMNPVLAEFVRLVTWGEIQRLLYGDTVMEAQMRNKYREHVKSMLDRETFAGLDAPLPRIERANREALVAPGVPMPVLKEIPA